VKPDCRNDCLEPLRFPIPPDNRPGLSHIKYRIGTYADIRRYLLRNLDKTPGLAQWTHRGADDPGIALLEGASILGDILTFYQELYANEAYLRTAQWRESIADLVRLLGYRLSPGLGGNATFAFEIKGDKPVIIPASFPVKAEVEGLPKPADFETSVQTIAYPWLSRFNLYRPLLAPDINSGTTEFYIADPDQLTAALPVALKQGDRLMIGEAASANPIQLNDAEVVIVDSTRELHGVTLIKIKGALKRTSSASKVAAFKLGRSFQHFGYNGPQKLVSPPASVTATSTVSADGKTTTTTTDVPAPQEANISFTRLLNGTTQPIDLRFVDPSLAKTEFPLDAELRDLPSGVPFVVEVAVGQNPLDLNDTRDMTLVSTIQSVRSVSITWGLVTATTSIVTLKDSLQTIPSFYYFADIRSFLFHEVLGSQLTLQAAMQEDLSTTEGQTLLFYGTDAQVQALNGRRLFLEKEGAEPLMRSVTAVEAEASPPLATRQRVRTVSLNAKVDYADYPNLKPFPVTVFGNLVDATQGKTEAAAALGNGDNRLVFQTFKLPKAPLTYLISISETPPEAPELQIYVNDRLWKRVSSFFDRKPDEEIYIVREDADNNSWVQFGDGLTGTRLPSGVKNVVARYRTGTGAFGALKLNTKVQEGARLERLDKIQMPAAAGGGSQPEDGENARDAAPGKIQSLDRLVSLKDFESETLAISGVSKASAAWQLVDNIPEVVLTVLMETGRTAEIDDVRQTLASYNRGRGPNRFPISVHQGRLEYVFRRVLFRSDSTYLEDDVRKGIQKALGVNSGKPNAKDDQSGLFKLRPRSFGQREYATSVAGAIQQVAGVVWAQVTRFDSLGPLDDPTTFTPPTTPVVVDDIVSCAAERVLSLYAGHLELTGVTEILPEVRK